MWHGKVDITKTAYSKFKCYGKKMAARNTRKTILALQRNLKFAHIIKLVSV